MILCKTVPNINYYKFSELSNYKGLKHFISTRESGVSKPPYNSLNLGLKVNDEKVAVILNRQALANAVGIDMEKFIIPSQCHGNKIQIVDTGNKGMGVFDNADAICDTDALITVTKGICLMIFAADCVPVLLFDPVKKVIAAVHAGWKGTVNKIVNDVVCSMSDNFETKPQNIIAGIGPSIGPCCYNIGDDVILKIKTVFDGNNTVLQFKPEINKVFFDLWLANKINLIDAGVLESNIEIAALCTSCRSDLFFSHRKSGGITGRFGAGIMLQ